MMALYSSYYTPPIALGPCTDKEAESVTSDSDHSNIRHKDMSKLTKFLRRRRRNSSVSSQLAISSLSDSDLPLRAKVLSCHPSLNKYSISANSLLEIYSVKSLKVAIVRSSKGRQYFVPFDAGIKLSPLFNPSNDLNAAISGHSYSTIGQLCDKASPLPVAVFSSVGFLGDSTADSMYAADIYLINKTEIMADSQEKVLVCEDVVHNDKDAIIGDLKRFPAYTKCELTTNPYKLLLKPPSLYLPYLKLPAEVMISSDLHAGAEIFTVLEVLNTECFVVALSNQILQKKRIIEIFDNVSIEVELIEPLNAGEMNLLRFNASVASQAKRRQRIIDESKYTIDSWQTLFLTNPTRVHKQADSVVLKRRTMISTNEHYSGSLPPSPRCKSAYNAYNPSSTDHSSDDNETYEYVTEWKEHHQSQATPVESNLTINSETQLPTRRTIFEENKAALENYCPQDVANILGMLGLSQQVQESFLKEKITGPLLMELDEEILMNELGVHRRLDRIKLLLIIEGKRHVSQIIEQNY